MNRNELPAVKPAFQFYPGQLDYLSLVSTKDFALIAADTGCGKTAFLVTLARMKCETDGKMTGRVLVVAPGGTLRPPKKEDAEDEDADEHLTMSQWRSEIARFAPKAPVFELFSPEDYHRACGADGVLPPGIYVTYYEALFRNGAMEFLPDTWLQRGGSGRRVPGKVAHLKLCKQLGMDPGPVHRTFLWREVPKPGWRDGMARSKQTEQHETAAAIFRFTLLMPNATDVSYITKGARLTHPPHPSMRDEGTEWILEEVVEDYVENYATGVGEEKRGIRCIAAPCLAEYIEIDQRRHTHAAMDPSRFIPGVQYPSVFDFVGLDESHVACNIESQLAKSLIRLQPRYRFAFTATPIPNIVTNLFSLMGWLCVPDWFRGGANRLNAAWPYHVGAEEVFAKQFLTVERDHTQEAMNAEANKGKRTGKCVKYSPVISSPARLLKIIRPTVAYISKPECNPRYQPPTLVDVRVPLGAKQAAIYAHFLDRENIPGDNPMVRAAKQSTWLRAIATDPVTFSEKYLGDEVAVKSDFSPKLIAVLELVKEFLEKGEQVVIVSARVGLTNIIKRRLLECGIECARIDSTIPPTDHSAQANRFKRRAVPVLLMGQKCAASHSFPQCVYEIVVSIEWSWGPLHQARGRVDRVNSRPGVNIYCVLCQDTIEETQFDRCATKGDAATICLEGRRVPRDFSPVDAGQILAANFERWQLAAGRLTDKAGEEGIQVRSEEDCESNWPKLRVELRRALERWKMPTIDATPEVKPAGKPAWMTILERKSTITK